MNEGELRHFSGDVINGYGHSETGRILLKENSSFIICGRSGSGKTTFIAELLSKADRAFENKHDREIFILYCYSSEQSLFSTMRNKIKNIVFHKGLPNDDIIEKYTSKNTRHLILVVDDLMREVVASPLIFDFFTVKAHHQGTSIIFVSHNLFQQGKFSRAIALNASYILLFENPRGADQIRTLSRQIFPGEHDMLARAYKLATESRQFSYLLVDMTANVPDALRLRSRVLPDEISLYYYSPS